MRGLWLLPKAAPVLMRHIGAYIELLGLDLTRARRELTAQFLIGTIVAICLMFAIFLGCLVVIASTWDTPYRVAAIAWMCGGFFAIAIGAIFYLSQLARASTPVLTDLRREWQQDRVILERMLSPDEG